MQGVSRGLSSRFYEFQCLYLPVRKTAANCARGGCLVGVDARIEFHVEEDGSVSELTLFQNGEHRAVRLADENGGEAIELGQFAGRYFSEELEAFYNVGVDQDGELFLRHRRFEPITLQHAAGDGFTGTLPVVTVEFERDEQGRVAALKAGNLRARYILFRRVD